MEVLVASNMLGLQRLTQLCEKAFQPLLEPDNVQLKENEYLSDKQTITDN